MHETALIATIAVGLGAALLFGLIARRVGLSPIIGYMIAGIAVGPYTPGFVADHGIAQQLAEIGVALLMFGVGLHFSARELLAVRRIAVPGAVFQSAVATAFGVLVGTMFGWSFTSGVVFGLALSVASTVVLIRGLESVGKLHSVAGHVAVGWLIVEDLFTVVMLVLLPAIAEASDVVFASVLGLTSLKMLALVAAYFVGVRVVPWLLGRVAHLENRELFTLAVLALALGIAYGAAAGLGVSMALGAFVAGMIVGQSDLSHQAAADALPLRDAFSVLFFVSVGMLFDPALLVERPVLVAATMGIVLVAKPVAAVGISLLFGYPLRIGLTVGAGLAQVGEFSFILGALALNLDLLDADAHSAIIAAALLTIAVNPVLFQLVEPTERALLQVPILARWLARRADRGEIGRAREPMEGHAVLCGHGRVGGVLGEVLRRRGLPFVVIDQNRAVVQRLRRAGVRAINGDASSPYVLDQADLATARMLLISVPDAGGTRLILHHARKVNPDLAIVARVHEEDERRFLRAHSGVEAVLGELELALEMLRVMLRLFGVSTIEAQAVAFDYRRSVGGGEGGGAGVLAGAREGAREGARVVEAKVTEASPAAGLRLMELGLGQGCLVMTIQRGDQLLVPDGRTELKAGDTVLLIADPATLPRVHTLF